MIDSGDTHSSAQAYLNLHPDLQVRIMRSRLRTAGLAATVLGAIASVALLVYVGNRGGSNKAQPVVMVLIATWVLSPYVILFAADALAKTWSDMTRSTLYGMMILVTVISLAVYISAATGPIKPKPAAPFVATPVLSWVLILIALSLASFIARRRQPQ